MQGMRGERGAVRPRAHQRVTGVEAQPGGSGPGNGRLRGVRRSGVRAAGVRLPVACVLLGCAGLPAVVHAQLPPPGARWTALAGSSMAMERGAGALAVHPGALGLGPGSALSLILPAASGSTGLDPITGRDLGRWSGRDVPVAERERWLARIEAEGAQRGRASAAVTPVALVHGRWGVQLSSAGVAQTRLPPDAAELLLFGNRRSPTYELAGASLDVAAFTTLAVGAGHPVRLSAGKGSLAVGGTLKYTEGSTLLVGRDAGSLVRGGEGSIDLRFPVVQSQGRHGGWGVGADVGVAWEGGAWSAGALVEHAFHTFAWDAQRLIWRAGEALLDGSGSVNDFAPRPLSTAAPGLLALAETPRFRPRLGLGLAWNPKPGTALTAGWKGPLTAGGIDLGPRRQLGVGVEHETAPGRLRAGAGWGSDGWVVAGGVAIEAGRFELGVSGQLRRGEAGPESRLAFALEFDRGARGQEARAP
jgi:hypothetical protein